MPRAIKGPSGQSAQETLYDSLMPVSDMGTLASRYPVLANISYYAGLANQTVLANISCYAGLANQTEHYSVHLCSYPEHQIHNTQRIIL